jgi:hypothetical protein
VHTCPTCGASCNCNGGDDLEEPAPDDCACPCDLDACTDCPHASGACEASPRCLLDADEDDDPACPSCGGRGAHFSTCPDLHFEDADDDCNA